MSKELWIDAHEELITEYLDEHPNATDKEAEDATADLANDRMIDKYSELADRYKERLGK